MDKITNLWVRACKSENPITRCESILRRFYMVDDNQVDITTAIVKNLSDIVDTHCPMQVVDVIAVFDRNQFKHFFDEPDDRSVRQKARDMLISRIQNTRHTSFKNMEFKKCLTNLK